MIYPSIDKLLTKVDSKYKLVHVAAQRARQMRETSFYQMKETDYKAKKDLGRAFEEIAENLIFITEN